VALDELVVQERETQIRLHTLGNEKKKQEQLLESAQKMLSERYYSSSVVISSIVEHVVELLKSNMPDLDTEQLHRNFLFDNNDDERDALINGVYGTVQYFVSQYDFAVVNDHDDNGNPDA
jgi:DNA repair protein RadC